MCHTTPAFRDLPNSKTQRKNKQTNKAPRSATNFRARGGEPRPAAAATQLRGPLWGGPRGGRGQRSPRRAPSDASSPAGPAAARGHRRRGRPARTKLPAPAPSPTAAAAAPAAPHAAPRPLRLTSAARPARSRAATVWGREREKNPSLRKWRQLWGGEGGGGKKRSRGGSGRGVWNIESRRGLCSAGLRPEGGAAQRLRKKEGWELGWARARAPGEAEGTRETPARCGLPPPPPGSAPPGRAVSKFRGERGGRGGRGGGARARCLPGGGARAAGARRARAVPARSRARSPHLPSPGGCTRPPARGQDKERGGDLAGWPLPPLAAEPVPEKAGARAPYRGAAVPRGGFRPGPASGRRLPIGLPASPGLVPSRLPAWGTSWLPGPQYLGKGPGRVVGSPPPPQETGD
ncbi:uncharacterized protein [Chlorocebus sabaeus]|uniref:uncharacterized protein n=1 Tax=Chlorocebus sabaeus TaxID=60711 RepID=UPI003BF9B7A5